MGGSAYAQNGGHSLHFSLAKNTRFHVRTLALLPPLSVSLQDGIRFLPTLLPPRELGFIRVLLTVPIEQTP